MLEGDGKCRQAGGGLEGHVGPCRSSSLDRSHPKSTCNTINNCWLCKCSSDSLAHPPNPATLALHRAPPGTPSYRNSGAPVPGKSRGTHPLPGACRGTGSKMQAGQQSPRTWEDGQRVWGRALPSTASWQQEVSFLRPCNGGYALATQILRGPDKRFRPSQQLRYVTSPAP